jgi:hypothetical protein
MEKLTTPKTKIKIENPISDFEEHLKSNKRILFSGKFGIGKTFFLKEFFQIPEIKEKYNVFHLFPVNYQIATNEDIFELIKYDILYYLFGFKWIKIDIEKFSKLLVAQSYLMNNSVSVFSKILKCIPLFGIDKAGEAIETLLNIQKKFLEYYNTTNQNDVTLLNNFREQIELKKGSSYEFDTISEFISENLANCNNDIEVGKHRENVLIIDDLDRIDPEHIFRLLNVFSAHIDRGDGTNKFGFDKIIFVCDVNNIRSIFAAKYGQQTDFSGYIDKFYSSQVFLFNNKVAIREFIRETMCKHKSKSKHCNYSEGEFKDIWDFLDLFVEGNSINLRQILMNVKDFKNKKQNIGTIGINYFPGFATIQACQNILGNQKSNLISAFEQIALPPNKIHEASWLKYIASYILPLSLDNIEMSSVVDGNEQPHIFNKNGVNIEFKLARDYDNKISAEIVSQTAIDFDTLKVIIVEAINNLDKKRLLD